MSLRDVTAVNPLARTLIDKEMLYNSTQSYTMPQIEQVLSFQKLRQALNFREL